MLKDKQAKRIFLMVIIFQLIVVFFFCFQKEGYHIDEILSHNLANSYYEKKNLSGSISYNEWVNSQDFNKIIMVTERTSFEYNSVFFNQSKDVHPPFYYVILHTICSFFPETFSQWYGLLLNIFLFIISNYLLFQISLKVFSHPLVALLPIIFWGVSAGAISTVLFIRMYMLLTTIVLSFVYVHFLLIESDGKNKVFFYISIFTFLGFMTHYFFLVFAFIWASLFILFLIIHKKPNKILLYIAAIFSALLTGYFIFPSSINHIFNSGRGSNAINNLLNYSFYSERLSTMFRLLSNQQFAGFLGFFIIVFTLLIIVNAIYKFYVMKPKSVNEKSEIRDLSNQRLKLDYLVKFYHENFRILSLAISVFATFIVVSIASHKPSTRFLYFIYPIISILAAFYIYQVFSLFIKDHRILLVGCIIIFVVLNTFTTFTKKYRKLEFLRPGYEKILYTAQQYGEYDCIYVTNNLFKVKVNIFELMNFQRTYILEPSNISQLTEILNEIETRDGYVLYLDNNQMEIINEILTLSDLENFNLLYSLFFTNTYFVN